MIKLLLVAVDDTPAALAGARLAVQLAAALPAEIHVVAVRAASQPDAPTGVLDYVRRLAEEADVPVHTALRTGDAAPRILAEARSEGPTSSWSGDPASASRTSAARPARCSSSPRSRSSSSPRRRERFRMLPSVPPDWPASG